MRTLTITTATIAAALLLASCSFNFSANRTISPDSLAETAGKAIQDEVGMAELPEFDCGEDHVALVEGETVVCDYRIDGLEGIYDVTVTITSVDGDTYGVSVQVADEPR